MSCRCSNAFGPNGSAPQRPIDAACADCREPPGTGAKEAIAAPIPISLAQCQNIALLDRAGSLATLCLGSERAPAVTTARACINHQESVVWPAHAESCRPGHATMHWLADLPSPT